MKLPVSAVIKYLPLVVGIAILAVAAPLVPWGKVGPYLLRLTPLDYMLLVGCSLLFYLGRIVRYWLMLRMLHHPVAFDKVAVACMVAQPVSVLPGGEMYRGAMLKRYGNVSLTHGAPSVFAQSIAESIGLLVIALIGAAVLHRYVAVLLVLTVIFGCIMGFIAWRNAHRTHHVINKIPFVDVHHNRLRSFLDKNRTLLIGRNFFVLVLASYISTFAGIAIVFLAAEAFGAHVSPLQAAIAYALPVALESVSFLPAGLGINEGSSVSILALFGTGLPVAVAITLITRLFTLGIGFLYGFGAMAWARIGDYRQYRRAS